MNLKVIHLITTYYEKFKKFMKENIFFFLTLLLIVFLFHFELPYVIYTPGGAIDLSERVSVENGYSSEGSFSMAYVSMVRGSIPFLLLSYVIPDWDIVPTEYLKSENESLDEMIEADQISLIQAQNHAVYAAYKLAGKEVVVTKQIQHLVYISEDADTDLELFDQILEIHHQKIENLDSIRQIVSKMQVGDEVEILIVRDGKEMTKHAKVYETSDGLKLGISITTTFEYDTDPDVSITFKKTESGPSGGFMTSLSIYNSLVSEDITKGRKIIGTGTIDEDGTVGGIGGVKYKLLGAVRKKADIFLVPSENYEEARQVQEERNLPIQLISVDSLQDAIEKLK